MFDPSHIDEPSRLNPVKQRRFSRAGLTLQVILSIIVVVSLNYLSCIRHDRLDLSRASRFSLSDRSIKFITSQDFTARQKPIDIVCAFRRNTPKYESIRNLIEDYENRSPRIKVRFIDPLRNPNEARELKNKYQLTFDRNQIIVDARPDPSRETRDESGQFNENARAHISYLSEDDLIVYENDANGTPKPVALQVEDALTAAIVAAVEGKPHRVYLITDKTNLASTSGKKAPYWRLFNALRLQNIELFPLRLGDIQSIPEDAEAIAFIGPQYDLEEKEIQVIEAYWQRPKSGLLMLLNPDSRLPRLFRFLRENGVAPRQDRIIRVVNGRPVFDVTAVFSAGVPFTKGFWATSTLFEGQSRSLEVREDDSRLSARQIRPVPLLEATRGYYGESRPGEPDPDFNPNEDYGGVPVLAAAIERGNITDNTLSDRTSRLVVMGNTEFLMPTKLRSEQLDFVCSSVNWMLDREELAGIGARETLLFKVSVDDPTRSAISAIALGLLPGISLLIALLVWNLRRR